MNAGSKESLNGLFDQAVDPRTSEARAELLGRNLWARGLKMVEQKRRIEREMAEAEEKRQLSLKKAARRKVRADVAKRAKKTKERLSALVRQSRERTNQRLDLPL